MIPNPVYGFSLEATLNRIILLACLLGVLLWASPGLAAEGGYSNYIPGTYGDFGVALTPEPGFYLQNYFYYYSADVNQTVRQGQVEGSVDLTIAMEFPILFYITDLQVLGGRYALGAGIPLVYADLSAKLRVGPFQRSISTDRVGIGDAYLIPVSLYWNVGDVSLNFYQGIVAPTGSYDVDHQVNTGLNYWSVDTNLAFTYSSSRIRYGVIL